jgi:hypothetical protein
MIAGSLNKSNFVGWVTTPNTSLEVRRIALVFIKPVPNLVDVTRSPQVERGSMKSSPWGIEKPELGQPDSLHEKTLREVHRFDPLF